MGLCAKRKCRVFHSESPILSPIAEHMDLISFEQIFESVVRFYCILARNSYLQNSLRLSCFQVNFKMLLQKDKNNKIYI